MIERRRDNKICVICILIYIVGRINWFKIMTIDGEEGWPNSRALKDTGVDGEEARSCIVKFSGVRVPREVVNKPVKDGVRNWERREFSKDRGVTDRIKCFRKVK